MNQIVPFRLSTKSLKFAAPEPSRPLTSVLCRHGRQLYYVRPGSRFRRDQVDGTAEIAEIVEVYRDPAGIVQFRYDATVEKSRQLSVRDGTSVLAARIFLERFEGPADAQRPYD